MFSAAAPAMPSTVPPSLMHSPTVLHLKLRHTPSLLSSNLVRTPASLVYAHRDTVVFVPRAEVSSAHAATQPLVGAGAGLQSPAARPALYDGLESARFATQAVTGDAVAHLAALQFKGQPAVAVAYESGAVEVWNSSPPHILAFVLPIVLLILFPLAQSSLNCISLTSRHSSFAIFAISVYLAIHLRTTQVYDERGKTTLFSHRIDLSPLTEHFSAPLSATPGQAADGATVGPSVYPTSLAPVSSPSGDALLLAVGLSTGHVALVPLKSGALVALQSSAGNSHNSGGAAAASSTGAAAALAAGGGTGAVTFFLATRGAAATALATVTVTTAAAVAAAAAAATAPAGAGAPAGSGLLAVGADDGSVGVFALSTTAAVAATTPLHLFEAPAVLALSAPPPAAEAGGAALEGDSDAGLPFVTGAETGLTVTALAFAPQDFAPREGFTCAAANVSVSNSSNSDGSGARLGAAAYLVAGYSTGHVRAFSIPLPFNTVLGTAGSNNNSSGGGNSTAHGLTAHVVAEAAAGVRRINSVAADIALPSTGAGAGAGAAGVSVGVTLAAEDGCVSRWLFPLPQPLSHSDGAAASTSAAVLPQLAWAKVGEEALLAGAVRLENASECRDDSASDGEAGALVVAVAYDTNHLIVIAE